MKGQRQIGVAFNRRLTTSNFEQARVSERHRDIERERERERERQSLLFKLHQNFRYFLNLKLIFNVKRTNVVTNAYKTLLKYDNIIPDIDVIRLKF